MFVSMQAQGLVLLQSILLGAGIGLFYDVLRALRRYFQTGRAMTALFDAVFWVGVLFVIFQHGITLAAGLNRYFVLAGAGCGAGLYFSLLSFAVLALLRTCFSALSFVKDRAEWAAESVISLARRLGLSKKIKECVKKFKKTPSIFRGKGLK